MKVEIQNGQAVIFPSQVDDLAHNTNVINRMCRFMEQMPNLNPKEILELLNSPNIYPVPIN